MACIYIYEEWKITKIRILIKTSVLLYLYFEIKRLPVNICQKRASCYEHSTKSQFTDPITGAEQITA